MVNAAVDTTERYVEREVAAYRNDPEFIANGWAITVAEEAVTLLQEGTHSQTWLAGQMGVSRSHVSAILTAPPNMTLLTLAKLAVALGVGAEVSLNPDRYRSRPKPSPEEDKDLDGRFKNAVTSGAVIVGTANATT
jgi:antitoxin component HigA of HigAB toxin-antitoxin module